MFFRESGKWRSGNFNSSTFFTGMWSFGKMTFRIMYSGKCRRILRLCWEVTLTHYLDPYQGRIRRYFVDSSSLGVKLISRRWKVEWKMEQWAIVLYMYEEIFSSFFVELAALFLNADFCQEMKICSPGAIHHARCMVKNLYSFKMFLFRSQFALTKHEISCMRDICVFLVQLYTLKPDLQHPLPSKHHMQIFHSSSRWSIIELLTRKWVKQPWKNSLATSGIYHQKLFYFLCSTPTHTV